MPRMTAAEAQKCFADTGNEKYRSIMIARKQEEASMRHLRLVAHKLALRVIASKLSDEATHTSGRFFNRMLLDNPGDCLDAAA